MYRNLLFSVLLLMPVLLIQGACASRSVAQSDYETFAGQQYVLRASGPLRADVLVPRGQGPFPAVIVIHGGGWDGGERADMSRFARELAANGFVAMNISYRLAPEAVHPAQLEDCRAAVKWLRQHAGRYKVDVQNIGAFGYSAGAHLAMLLGVNTPVTEQQSQVQAVVAGAGPTDLRAYPNSPLVQAYLGGPPEGREALYADASPIVHVSTGDAPVYIYHGKRDALVGVEQAEAMAEALEAAQVDVELDIQPFGHILTYFIDRRVMDRALAFLKAKLAVSG